MFRVLAISVVNHTSFQIAFSQEPLDEVSVSNFLVYADQEENAEKKYLTIYSVEKDRKVLTIHHSYATPLLSYKVVCQDSVTPFVSVLGEALQNDGTENVMSFIGQESSNDIRDSIKSGLPNIYDPYEDNDLSKYVSNISHHLKQARTAMRQTSNAIYVETIETDTVMVRGAEGTDRLPQESAYQVDRVSRFISGSPGEAIAVSFDQEFPNPALTGFPATPYLLRQKFYQEEVSNVEREQNSFDGLTLNLAKQNVTQVLQLFAIVAGIQYEYDLVQFPVAILNSRYDPIALQNSTLKSNQIRLSRLAIDNGNIPAFTAVDSFIILYSYDNKGIRTSNVQITQEKTVLREIAPANTNMFNLKNKNISGVEFLYPVAMPNAPAYTAKHPAFTTEIEFDKGRPPSASGEYSVNYTTGQVYVWGYGTGTGTGNIPPAATYQYTKYYKENVDYSLDIETDEIVAISDRGLVEQKVLLNFLSQEVYIDGVDYVAEVHNEVVNEFIDNRFSGNDRIRVLNGPITDVFEIFNQTTGETYTAANFNFNEIQISGQNLPRRKNVTGELASMSSVFEEDLYVGAVEAIVSLDKIYSIKFAQAQILAQTGSYLGSYLNSSLIFNSDLLTAEVYFSENLPVSTNIALLDAPGKYSVNYRTGVLYVRLNTPEFYLGNVSYRYGAIDANNSQITSVNNIYYADSNADEKIVSFDVSEFTNNAVFSTGIQNSLEGYFDNVIGNPIMSGSVLAGSLGYWVGGTDVFAASDAIFTPAMADGYHTLNLATDNSRIILQYISPTSVRVDLAFSDTDTNVAWTVVGTDNKKTYVTYPPRFVKGVYLSSDVLGGTLNPTNYFAGTFSGNSIDLLTNPSAISDGLFVDYDFGALYFDYEYMIDQLVISYEWGDNEIRWLNGLSPGQNYFVTYRYGALRRELKENFAALMGIDDLINSDLNMNREVIRDLTKAALRVFVGGPTYQNLITLGEIPTLIAPTVKELSFDEWTLDRDNLYPTEPKLIGVENYTNGYWGKALDLTDSHIELPSESIISYRSGAFYSKLQNHWSGLNLNADIILDFPGNIYVGEDSLLVNAGETIVSNETIVGRPKKFWSESGLFFWLDKEKQAYQLAFVGPAGTSIVGTVKVNGEIYYSGDGYIDGYGYEASDLKRTRKSSMDLELKIDGYDTVEVADGYTGFPATAIYADTVSFRAGKPNFIFDAGFEDNNRLSLYKDPAGWIVFRAIDQYKNQWALSADVRNWETLETHDVGVSWRLNSAEGQDEMHIFIDGKESTNNYRFGGLDFNGSLLRSNAIEIIDSSVTSDAFFIDTLSSTAGSAILESVADLSGFNIQIGDSLFILENTNDGMGSPYTIVAFDSNTITLNSALTLSMDDLHISVNATTYTLATDIDAKFAVMVNGTEIPGLDAEVPAYNIIRSNGTNYLTIYDGIVANDTVTCCTLGLSLARARFMATATDGLLDNAPIVNPV